MSLQEVRARSRSTAPATSRMANSSSRWAVRSSTRARLIPISWSGWLRGQSSGRSAYRRTRWATALWSAYRTARCWRFETGSLGRMRGTAVMVPVLEAGSKARIGRFGWKSQHASLESFSADAYLNEMGITSPLFPRRTRPAVVRWVSARGYDPVPDPEDDGVDVVAFANFMRSTKAPSRGPITADVRPATRSSSRSGAQPVIPRPSRRPRRVRPINGGAFTVPEALGNKIIHPYSDFLLHDVGTGDGIPVLPTRRICMDGKSDAHGSAVGAADSKPPDARWPVVHHAGSDSASCRPGRERKESIYNVLSQTQKNQLLAFLNSL